MMEVLHREHTFSDMFVAYLLTRNIRNQEDLIDQPLNSSEKRLARMLLLLAHFGKDGKPEVAIPKISQETLAEMIGPACAGAGRGSRTPKTRRSADFESAASASSAIPALRGSA